MTVDFCDYFWGEKNSGFDVLYRNMKYGQVASKELVDFLRERSSIEEAQSKLLSKLAKQAGSGCIYGTFAPLWQVLKASLEKLSSLHQQMVQQFQELIKEVVKYCDEQHKNHKGVKEGESGTLEAVQSIQSTTVTLQKAKESYNQRCIEYEKLKRENGSSKEVEKAEAKLKRACEDYKALVDKYGVIRDEFERKMTLACQHFQEVEETHLRQMKEFLQSYVMVLENGHNMIGQVHQDFQQQCSEMTVDKLLEQFSLNKATGKEKPAIAQQPSGLVHFEEVDLSCLVQNPQSSPVSGSAGGDATERLASVGGSTNGDRSTCKEGNNPPNTSGGRKSRPSRRTTSLLNLFLPSHGHSTRPTSPPPCNTSADRDSSMTSTNSSTPDPALSRNTFRGSKWLWKSGRRDKKEKKLKKQKGTTSKEDVAEVEEKNEKEADVQPPDIPEVDEEGYSIRPDFDPKENHRSSFYSSSDSDSEDEKCKIHVEIKPLSNGTAPLSASIDELRASIIGLTLPSAVNSNRKSPNTDLDSTTKSKRPGADLLAFGGSIPSPSTSSAASTPTGGGGTSVPSPVSSDHRSVVTTPTRSEESGDLFSELGDLPPALPPKYGHSTGGRVSTPVGAPLLPRPPSRRAMEPPGRGRMSPVSCHLNRADSLGSLSSEFRASSMSVGSSRGPSPLTIGMSDVIPIAVAFQEVAHAYFKGSEESRCQVKLMGDMMISFPAGIIQVLANNPSPATLSFRVKNVSRLESIIPNKQLITATNCHSPSDQMVYEFNMLSLTSLLRRQTEQNPTASYFNVDILKYQIRAETGAHSAPLHLVCYWKCNLKTTDLKLDYKYNGQALITPVPLLNLVIHAPVDGGVTGMQSKPKGEWGQQSNRAVWRLTELSQHSDDNGTGCIRAKFDVNNGPSTPGTIAAVFSVEGTTMSGADFELVGLGYRVSLIKRRIITGKYICESEVDMKYRYAAPPV